MSAPTMSERPTRAGLRVLSGAGDLQRSGVWIACLVLVVYNVATTSRFLSMQTLQTNLTQMAAVAIAAFGMTLVIATGGIDLSVGSLMALAGASGGLLLLSGPEWIGSTIGGTLLVLVVGILVATAFGLVNGFLVAKLRIQPIVATLVVLIAGRGIAQLTTSGRLFEVKSPTMLWLGRGEIFGIAVQAWIMVVIFLVLTWVCRSTVFGRQLVAVGGNERAAALAGVRAPRVKYVVYGLSGTLAGVAGLLSAGINGTVDTANLGLGWEFTTISAVVVGGTALTGGRPRLVGTLGGVVLLQLLAFTLASHDIPKEVAQLVQAAVIVVAVTMQTRGGTWSSWKR